MRLDEILKKLDHHDLAFGEISDSVFQLRALIKDSITEKLDERITAIEKTQSTFQEMLNCTLENIKQMENNVNKLGSMTLSLMQQNQELTSHLAKKYVCVSQDDGARCVSTNVLIYFCKNCEKSFSICNEHLQKNRITNLCSVCGKREMARRFAIPFPEQNCNYKKKDDAATFMI